MTHIVDMTQSVALELFDYDVSSGELRWKDPIPAKYYSSPRIANMVNTRWAGKPAANMNKNTGYLQVVFQRKLYQVHRIIWLMLHGSWPAEQIDHKSRVRVENTPSNLKAVSHAENMLNRSDNTSGHPNIHYRTGKPKPWMVSIKSTKKLLTSQSFTSLPEAIAHRDAIRSAHGLPAV